MRGTQASPLAHNVSGFAKALAAIITILLLPLITRYLRPEIYDYFVGEFPGEWSYVGSWIFVVLVGICAFFGVASLFQMIVQFLFHRKVRKGGF